MRTAIDQMLDLSRSFSSDIRLTKDSFDKYLVSINRVSYKEDRNDIMDRSIFANGDSIEAACSNFLNKAKGKILFGNDDSYYGNNAPEFICV